MCDEPIKAGVEQIKFKHAKTLEKLLKSSLTAEEKERLCSKVYSHCTFAIDECRVTTYSYMPPATSIAPVTVVDMSNLIPGLELDFS